MTTTDTPFVVAEPSAVPAAVPTREVETDWTSAGLVLRALEALEQHLASGPQAVLEAAAAALATLAGTPQVAFLVPSRSSWRVAAGAAPTGDLARRAHKLGPASRGWDGLVPVAEGGVTFVSLRPGSLALVLPTVLRPSSPRAAAVRFYARACEMMVANAESAAAMDQLLTEVSTLESVAGEILSIRDLDEVLASIAGTARALLEGDMGGVLLLEDDRLVMRSCMGNRSAQTAKLRISRGQGVAGRVLETGQPCKVDSYLKSGAISHDFDSLARLEDTRSAIGVPLTVRREVIGVLEVWRRRPSLFTQEHLRRLVALANLAAIAIENARLYDRQEESVRLLATARETLSSQLDILEGARTLQRNLVQHLLAGEGLPAIVRTSASQLGGTVAVFSDSYERVASYPREAATDWMSTELRRVARKADVSGAIAAFAVDGGWFTAQAIRAGGDSLGWFCAFSQTTPDTAFTIAMGEAALTCALAQLEQRGAEQARIQDREELLWDLLDGTAEHRQGAVSRAKRLRLDLASAQRVVMGVIDNFDVAVRAEGWDGARVERLGREILGMARRVMSHAGAGDLVSFRRDSLIALVPVADAGTIRDLLERVGREVSRILPGADIAWGVSGPHAGTNDFGPAGKEAHAAVRATRRMGKDRPALYDELGVVRLLLSSETGCDLREFVDDVIGPMLEHDRTHDGVLTHTLRAYFDANCSQLTAAKNIFVHHKTMHYRLGRIEALTHLDLSCHDDRLRADLAMKIHEVMSMQAADLP